MSEFRYSFVPVRYVHDALTGEALNVGIVLYSPDNGYLRSRLVTDRTKRFAEAFRGFDSRFHRFALSDLQRGLLFLREREYGPETTILGPRPDDVAAIMKRVWPDRGSRYTFGESSHGVSENLNETLEILFERFVESQMPEVFSDEREKDERVWKRIESPLRRKVPLYRMQPHKVETTYGSVVLKHTYRNGKLNIFQPLSFDLSDNEAISRKASTWFGNAHQFAKTETIGSVVYIVGAPRAESKMQAFERAVAFLREAEKPKVFLDGQIDPIAECISKIMGQAQSI
jgi:hypothetical protein